MDDATRPLYALTQAVLAALDRGSYAALEPLTTHDLTFVDGHAELGPLLAQDRGALRQLLASREGVTSESTILAYDGHPDRETGWSVVRLRRATVGPRASSPQHEVCTATLLWTLTPDGWKLSRWHCTPVRAEAPS